MTDEQENKRSMAHATMTVMNAYSGIWSALAGPSSIVANINDVLTLVDSNAVTQAGTTTGVTQARSNARDVMTGWAMVVAGGGLAYANVNDDAALAAKFNYVRSDLTKARDTEVTDIANIILGAANDNAAALVDYNVSGSDITNLEAAITTYDGLESGRDAVVARSLATKALDLLFGQLMDGLNNELDPFMETYKNREEDFYISYKNARKIVDLGRGRSGGDDEPSATD